MPARKEPLRSAASSIALIAHTLTLEQLLDGAREGLRPHIGELYRRYGPELLQRVQREDSTTTADTIMADVFLKLPDALRSYQHTGKFEAWLWAIARNLLTDRRRQRRRIPEPVSGAGEELVSPLQPGLSFERGDLIERLTTTLTPKERDVFLHNLQGYSDQDTAARLGLTANNVAQILFRARGKVRREAEALGLHRSDILDAWLDRDRP